jgi:hypothetical protein
MSAISSKLMTPSYFYGAECLIIEFEHAESAKPKGVWLTAASDMKLWP